MKLKSSLFKVLALSAMLGIGGASGIKDNAQSAAKLRFEQGSHKRYMQLDPIDYIAGQKQRVRLPETGLLARIDLQVILSYTVSNATTDFDADQDAGFEKARAVLPVIKLLTNNNTELVNCSAYELLLLSVTGDKFETRDDKMAYDRSDAPTGTGAKTVEFNTTIPIALNEGLNWDKGLLNLQNPQLRASLELQFADWKQLFETPGNISNVVGMVIPTLTYYDVPNLEKFEIPSLRYLYKISSERKAIVRNGEERYEPQKGNLLLQTIHQVIINHTPATIYVPGYQENGNIKNVELKFQKSTSDFRVPAYFHRRESARLYGSSNLPAGCIYFDSLTDTGARGRYSNGMQVIDTRRYTHIEQILELQNIDVNATELRTVTRELVILGRK